MSSLRTPANAPGLPSTPAGLQHLASADDDELSGAFFVACDPGLGSASVGEPISCIGRFEITGDTGAFAEAVGMVHQAAFVWFPGSPEAQDWPWVSGLGGTISY